MRALRTALRVPLRWLSWAPFALLVSGVQMSAPASAQSDSGPEARMRGKATCFANTQPAVAKSLFEHIPGSRGERKASQNFLSIHCLIGGESIEHSFHFRAAVAEHLVEKIRDGGEQPGRVFQYPSGESLVALDDAAKGYMGLINFGECLAIKFPEEATAILATEPGTTTARKAFGALVPNLGQCAMKGVEFDLTRELLRDVVAEGSYRVLANNALQSEGAE